MSGADHHTLELKQISFLLILATVTFMAVVIVWPFATTLLWSALAAIMFQPLYRWCLKKCRGRRNPAALLALTRTTAAELGPKGSTVNMVSGGLLRTTDASAATPPEVFDFIAGTTPLRSVTTPEEAADAVLFFACPWARAVTGQNLIVDGGMVFG